MKIEGEQWDKFGGMEMISGSQISEAQKEFMDRKISVLKKKYRGIQWLEMDIRRKNREYVVSGVLNYKGRFINVFATGRHFPGALIRFRNRLSRKLDDVGSVVKTSRRPRAGSGASGQRPDPMDGGMSTL